MAGEYEGQEPDAAGALESSVDGDGDELTGEAVDEFAALAEAEATATEAEQAAQAEALASVRSELAAQRTQTLAAVVRYREAVLAAEPELPPDLVGGESLEEVERSLEAARRAVAQIRERLSAEGEAGGGCPVGAPARGGLSALGPARRRRSRWDWSSARAGAERVRRRGAASICRATGEQGAHREAGLLLEPRRIGSRASRPCGQFAYRCMVAPRWHTVRLQERSVSCRPSQERENPGGRRLCVRLRCRAGQWGEAPRARDRNRPPLRTGGTDHTSDAGGRRPGALLRGRGRDEAAGDSRRGCGRRRSHPADRPGDSVSGSEGFSDRDRAAGAAARRPSIRAVRGLRDPYRYQRDGYRESAARGLVARGVRVAHRGSAHS